MRKVRASLRHIFPLTLMLVLVSVPLWPQSVLRTLAPPAIASPLQKYSDPLGRTTPRGTLTGFMAAAQLGNYDRAAEYLQLPRQEIGLDSTRVIADLKALLDHAYVGRLGTVTDNPELTYDPHLDANHERIGEFSVNGKELPLLMVRVPDGNNGYIWLISWSTLSKTGDLANDVRSHEMERRIPPALVHHTILSIPLWVWLAFLLLVPLALAAGAVAVALVSFPAWLLGRIKHRAAQWEVWNNIRGPVLLFAAAAAHAIGMRMITVPLLFREYYLRVQAAALLFAVAWLLWDFATVWTRRMRRRFIAPEERGTLSLILLLHRVLKVLIVTAAFLFLLYLAGFNLSAALAGLGIGGIAVALAAQKTIENFFGGVSILTDRVMRVGDICRVGDTIGKVEDIGLRSTRIRTFDRGLISVPNGTLASANVENLSARDKLRIFAVVSLTQTASRAQIEAVLEQIGAMLRENPQLESGTSWVRLARLGTGSTDLEMHAYVLTSEYSEFINARQEILLGVMHIVERCGTSLASNTPVINVGSTPEIAEARALGSSHR